MQMPAAAATAADLDVCIADLCDDYDWEYGKKRRKKKERRKRKKGDGLATVPGGIGALAQPLNLQRLRLPEAACCMALVAQFLVPAWTLLAATSTRAITTYIGKAENC